MPVSGYEKLKTAVEKDCNDRGSCGCFNPNGCDVPNQSTNGKRCSHSYCDKFNWVIKRAKLYGEKLGVSWEDIPNSWKDDRSYWYINYYQECNQPEIKGDKVRIFDTVQNMLKRKYMDYSVI